MELVGRVSVFKFKVKDIWFDKRNLKEEEGMIFVDMFIFKGGSGLNIYMLRSVWLF